MRTAITLGYTHEAPDTPILLSNIDVPLTVQMNEGCAANGQPDHELRRFARVEIYMMERPARVFRFDKISATTTPEAVLDQTGFESDDEASDLVAQRPRRGRPPKAQV